MYDDLNHETPPEGHHESQAWLVTFTDLVSLMLTFFVMLFAMSSVKIDRWKEMTDALSTSLNPQRTPSIVTNSAKFNIGTIFRRQAINLDYLDSILSEAMTRDPLLKKGTLMRLDDRLVFALPGDLLFKEGGAVMTDKAREAMFSLGGLLRNVGNTIGVNGHSDPSPPTGAAYASNWELSVARSVAVANALRRSGYTEEIIAYGFSDTRYGELPDMPDDQRRALARRVDIVILPTAGES